LYYETLGLLPSVARTESGYRQYADRAFIRCASSGVRSGLQQGGELLKLWQNPRQASANVKRIALAHVADLDRRMAERAEMRQTLRHLADCCAGDHRPDCPILENLQSERSAPEGARAVVQVVWDQGPTGASPPSVAKKSEIRWSFGPLDLV
jgi:DNA-binding transcriptional MerR regulator